MGQLAGRRKHAANSSAEWTHYAIWISVAVVWRRGDAAEGIDSGSAVAAGPTTEERGAVPSTRHL